MAGLTIRIERDDPRICRPQRAAQARQGAGQVAVAFFRARPPARTFQSRLLEPRGACDRGRNERVE
jgi:hypothetical protein